MPRVDEKPAVLEVNGLVTEFVNGQKRLRALDEVTFDLRVNETLGIVGESGCGKSLTSLSIMQLLPQPHGRITAGSIRFNGRELVGVGEYEMRKIRGADIAMIFQEPLTALNPVLKIGRQLAEPLKQHTGMDRHERRRRIVEMLDLVRIPDAARRLDDYPHQLSGGMRQRVMIAMGVMGNPVLLIADEPTTALDVTVQAQIIELLRRLNAEHGTAVLLISHDVSVIGELCDRIIVMYGGRIMEQGRTADVLATPRHPYTAALLAAVPTLSTGRDRPLVAIPGQPPSPADMPAGCPFAPRCPAATDICRVQMPALTPAGTGKRATACWHPLGASDPAEAVTA